MTTGRTTNLDLALPVEGELDGQWGDEVNNGITKYIDIAVAGTLTLTGDGAVTLALTEGDNTADNIGSTTAQYAILKIVGPLTATKVITGPSSSKTYIVNNTDSTYGVTVKASGQTGVTVAAGQRALVVFNGTDYVQVGASAGGSNTQVQYNNNGALAGSANLTFDGTTLTAANFADSSLTSGRVVTAGASGNLGDSANLTWDGSNFQIGSQGDLRLGDSDNSNWVALQAPATVASNVTWTLPNADGTSGQVLSTNGSGTLSFATVSSPAKASGALIVNTTTVGENYVLPSGSNAFSVGPITVSSGFAVTVSSGQRWVVI